MVRLWVPRRRLRDGSTVAHMPLEKKVASILRAAAKGVLVCSSAALESLVQY